MQLTVYLAGEIHSDWRIDITSCCADKKLDVTFLAPETNHAMSDACGSAILGEEASPYWRDHKSARLNAIRIRTAIDRADVVVVKFGEQYKQWNAAFDAGYAVAKGKPLIVIHPPEHNHALKEIDAAALAVAETPEQVAEVLAYVLGA
ncbi:MAG: YtoQ family protein [Rhodospirillales bacterium]|nr:YtoQ family protein [Rhodospirillales bacterium]